MLSELKELVQQLLDNVWTKVVLLFLFPVVILIHLLNLFQVTTFRSKIIEWIIDYLEVALSFLFLIGVQEEDFLDLPIDDLNNFIDRSLYIGSRCKSQTIKNKLFERREAAIRVKNERIKTEYKI